MKYDYGTLREGLMVISNETNFIVKKGDLTKEEEQKLSEHIFGHFFTIAQVAISRNDEKSAKEVVYIFEKIGLIANAQKFLETTCKIAGFIGRTGLAAAEKKLETVTSEAAVSLGKIRLTAVKRKGLTETMCIADFLRDVGVASAKQKLENPIVLDLIILNMLE